MINKNFLINTDGTYNIKTDSYYKIEYPTLFNLIFFKNDEFLYNYEEYKNFLKLKFNKEDK